MKTHPALKVVIFVLCVLAAFATLAAITGANVLSSLGPTGQSVLLNRTASLVAAAYCGVSAYACLKRKGYGWWMVTVLWVLMLLGVLAGAIWNAMHIGLPPLGLLLGGIGELVKIGVGGWLLFRVWLPVRDKFDGLSEQMVSGRWERRHTVSDKGHSMAKKVVWWLTWAVLTTHLVVLPLLLGIHLSNSGASEFGGRVAFVVLPLAIATGIRWLVLPRMGSTIPAFFLFLVGLILADMSGLMMLFLQPPYRAALYCLCVAGMLQFIPLFILKKKNQSGLPTNGGASATSG